MNVKQEVAVAEGLIMLKDIYNLGYQDGIESVKNASHDREKIAAAVNEVLERLGFGPPPEIAE